MIQLTVFDRGNSKCIAEIDSLVWLGREYSEAESTRILKPYDTTDPKGLRCIRIAYVSHTDHAISRWSLSLIPIDSDRVRVESAGKNSYTIDGFILEPFKPIELQLPIKIKDRSWTFSLEPIVQKLNEQDEGFVNVLELKPIAPYSNYASISLDFEDTNAPQSIDDLSKSAMIAPLQNRLEYSIDSKGQLDITVVLRMLEGTLGIIQSAVTDVEFFERAVQVMVNLLDLDQGWALTLNKMGDWKVVATVQNPRSEQPFQKVPNDSILRKLKESGQSAWMRLGDQNLTRSEILIGLSESVGAPVLNPSGQVVGGLCGVKFVDDYYSNATKDLLNKSRSQTLTELRVIIMQILAGCVASGIAHLTMRSERDQLETMLEQYFTKKVSERIKTDPNLLRGSEYEITSLFCDIRNFSRISANLEPDLLLEWLQESLSTISECVPNYDGIVVDYIGDELMAIWGEISTDTDQAARAVKAGFAMIKAVEQLSDLWMDRLGGKGFSVGVGINTGNAFVGNIGTPRKLKFGAIGNSVNLASRVQGVTKHFGCPFLVTHHTWEQLDGKFLGRRIGSVSLVNIPAPVDLYQVFSDHDPEKLIMCQNYELALAHFENQEFSEAAAIAGQILNHHRDDRPSIILLQRAIGCLIDPDSFSKTIVITGK